MCYLKKGVIFAYFRGWLSTRCHPCPGVDFVPATAIIGPLPEHHYLELNIEKEEEGKAERVREQLVLKVKKTKPRWLYQTLILA